MAPSTWLDQLGQEERATALFVPGSQVAELVPQGLRNGLWCVNGVNGEGTVRVVPLEVQQPLQRAYSRTDAPRY